MLEKLKKISDSLLCFSAPDTECRVEFEERTSSPFSRLRDLGCQDVRWFMFGRENLEFFCCCERAIETGIGVY